MRKILIGLLGAAALTAATSANAGVTVDPGTTVLTSPPIVSSGGQAFDFGYTDSSSGSPFTEILNFTNSLAGNYSITLSTTSTTTSNDIDFFASLACATCGIFLSGGSIAGSLALTPDIDNNDINEDYSLNTGSLGAGSYTLTFIGNGSGSFGGNVSFSAVPEPATWGMMLLGFGAIGFAMRRRRSSALVQIA
jgi:hypothetical protein